MIRNVFCVVTALVWTFICFWFTTVPIFFTRNASRSFFVVRRWWSPGLLWAGGAKLEVTGLENVDASVPQIYVSNHQSTIDIPTLFMALPVDCRFVAKRSLQWVPFLGWYMTLAKFVFVDRMNHRNAIASLDKAAARIQGGISIIVFPEGTRSNDQTVKPFKKGPFALAMKAGVPIVPITIEGSGKLMPKNSWNITPGPIRVMCGKAIDPKQFGDDREALTKAVRDVIIEQSLAMGGKGGDRKKAIAARGFEGVTEEESAES